MPPPKLSKLQQLAAARKKKIEEKKSDDKVEGVRTKMSDLGLSSALGKKENVPMSGGPSKRQKIAETTAVVPPDSRGREPKTSHDAMDVDSTIGDAKGSLRAMGEEVLVPESARPSAFAKTLFGNTSGAPPRPQQDNFALPFASHPAVLEAFSGPSPDDVVLAAQAKGSLSGKGETLTYADSRYSWKEEQPCRLDQEGS